MLRAIAIENFKGIGSRVELELRPITLLFGPNSGGKSTTIQAIQYGFEVLDRGNIDADRTMHGGGSVDLGGFRNFVHNRESERTVALRFELDFSDEDLPELTPPVGGGEEGSSAIGFNDFLGDQIRTAWVELEVGWDDAVGGPQLHRYGVGANGETVAWVRSLPGATQVELCDIEMEHDLLRFAENSESLQGDLFEGIEHQLARARQDEERLSEERRRFSSEGRDDSDESTRLNAALEAARREVRLLSGELPVAIAQSSALPTWGRLLPMTASPEYGERLGLTWEQFHYRVSALLVGLGQVVRDRLAAFRYIGPLRSLPSRGYVPPRYAGDARWDNGIAAWSLLHRDDGTLLRRTDEWMGDEERLKTGVGIRRRRVRRVPEDSALSVSIQSGAVLDDVEELQRELGSLRVQTDVELYDPELPEIGGISAHDVGVGIAQVLPVVVAALDSTGGHFLAIEQPELHVHPRIQTELADLFASQIREGKQFVIETHSEHIVLRLMKRIEQTTGDDELPPGAPRVTPEDLAVTYVRRSEGEVTARQLRIDSNGDFIDEWPDGGFFKERNREIFD